MSRPVYEPKHCPCCLETKPPDAFYKNAKNKDGLQGYCIPCWKVKVREWQDRSPEKFRNLWKNRTRRDGNRWRQNHREATRAHNQVAKAIRNGILERPGACGECGKTGRVEAHHKDYALPLVVEWLCPRCHRLTHTELVETR